ncbi:long-subunit acyl-CoA synthetase (AMP-forming) [Alteromonas sp. 76-1]|jgi:long-chain acyl-CoA synthetase|nr:long-subunit acyl-CoA synthetase (AMP-forming) [Alteromonas sp. 76-1]
MEVTNLKKLHLLERALLFSNSTIDTKSSSGQQIFVTFDKFVEDVRNLASRLSKAGISKGHFIGLQSPNCYEALVWDLATIELGSIIHFFPEESQLDNIKKFERENQIALWVTNNKNVIEQVQHVCLLDVALSGEPIVVNSNAVRSNQSDLLTRVYSSGTSGYLKGLEISSQGTERLVLDFVNAFSLNNEDKHLIFLPLSNYQQRLSVYGCLYSGASIALCHFSVVFNELRRVSPTFIIAPPAIYENIYHLYLQDENAKESVSNFLGNNVRFMITGMAPIRTNILQAFSKWELPLFEAYGVTETGMIAWNTFSENCIGSVGKPINRDHVLLTDDKEILIDRPFPLSRGYFECSDQDNKNTYLGSGLIATGDIGEFNESGFLFLIGRKKEIIVTSGGIKFHPEQIEKRLNLIVDVLQSVVVISKETKKVHAVIVVPNTDKEFCSNILEQAQAINYSLESYQQIQNFVFTDTIFTIENEMLTRNLKLNRKAIYTNFENRIESSK